MNRIVFFFAFFLLAFSLKSQDTFTLNICTRHWKTGELMKGFVPLAAYISFDTTEVCSKFVFTPADLAQRYCPAGARYTNDSLNGVNVSDMITIRDHILGIKTLPSLWSILAADANRSGAITTLDIVLIRKMLLGTASESQLANPSWFAATFIKDTFPVQDPFGPGSGFGCDTIAWQSGQTTGQATMKAVKKGDADGDARVIPSPMVFSHPPAWFSYSDQWVLPGEVIAVPISLLNNWRMKGLQLAIGFDASKCTLLDTVQSGAFNTLKNAYSSFQDNTFRTVQLFETFDAIGTSSTLYKDIKAGERLFTLYLRAKTSFRLKDVISVRHDVIPGFFVDINQQPVQILFKPGNRVSGKVYADDNLSCSPTAPELPIAQYPIELINRRTGQITFATSNAQGEYQITADTGTYTLKAAPWNYWEACTDSIAVVFGANTTDSVLADIGLQKTVECPLLEVSLTAPVLRRCFENNYYVSYRNLGTKAAPEVRIEITLPPELTYVASTLAPVSISADKITFMPGSLDIGAGGDFKIILKAACDSLLLGSYVCVNAHIFPDVLCKPDPRWSGASVEIKAKCVQNTVDFDLQNTGTAPTQTLEFVIIEDQVIMRTAPFQLAPGETRQYLVPAQGKTLRLTAEQEPFHPVPSMPTVAVEGCGTSANGTVTLGVAGQFPEHDGAVFIDKECLTVTGSFDPNDKTGFPEGVKAEHFITPGTALEYRIRFQNTGTDTAFNVVITDTLSEWLDPATLEIGSASHPFQWELHGRSALKFVFHNILLPDSNRNEKASHGFVKFRIQHRPQIALGSVIHNKAAIYFDFNAPVITNETWHTVDTGFLRVFLQNVQPFADVEALTVAPNPVHPGHWIHFKNLPKGIYQVHLMDMQGREVFAQSMTKGWVQIGQLPPGMYYYILEQDGKQIGVGKLAVAGR